IMASPSALDMFGYDTLADLPNKNIGRDFYLDPDQRVEFTNAITLTGSVRNFEAVLKKQDGTPVYAEISSHFLYNSNGVPVGMEGVLRDISMRKDAAKKLQHHIGEMEFLSQKLLEFIMMEPSENIFKKILSDLTTLVPDSTILVNSFSKLTGMVTVQCYEASEQRREAIFRALGRDLTGCEFPIDSGGIAAFQTGRLTQGDISLFEVAFKSIPKSICERLESELEISGKYAIGFVRRGEIMGNAAIFLAGERTIPNQRIVEMYAREAAIALQRYLAEEEQRRSDEIFINIAQYSPLPIALINADDTFYFINESQKQLFGYTLNDFHTVQEWLGLILPEPAEFEKASDSWLSHKSKYRAGDSYAGSYIVRCRDGTPRNIIVRIVFLSLGKICVITEDMTDRIRAEQTNRLLSSIIQNTDDAVIAKDTRGTIISWNRAAERLYGYSAAEAIGQDITLIIPSDKTEESLELFNRIERGESVNNLETRRIRKDGRFVDVSLTISPIMDDYGTIIGASTIARDLTRYKAEERLRENEEQYRSLMENISVGFYRSTGDPTGRFIWGNSSLIHTLGYTSFEQLSGVDIADLFVEQDGRKKLLDDLKKEHFIRNREIALRRADGTTVTVIVNAFARFDQNGNLSCISGIVEDISGQKHAEARVQILDQQIEDILASIPDAVVITDHKNRVLAWNIAMEKVTGVEKANVAGRDDYEHLFPFYDPSRPTLVTLFDAADGDLERYYPGAYRDGATLVAQVQPLQNRKNLPGYFIHRVSPLSDLQGQRIGAVQIISPPDPDGRNSTRQSR
ncbi:MAG TPA: PAS domain S-box protein, partial [Methanoregula sp.]|nr:PAS domain S-box protein [Methanoregula sp.]